MGLQDRPYYQDSYSSPWDGGGGYSADSSRSVIMTLIIINVVIFLVDSFTPRVDLVLASGETVTTKTHWLADVMGMRPAAITSAPWKIWQFITYGFSHAALDSKESVFHVGGNMFILFMLGRPIEQRLGRSEFIRFYLIAILFAGLGYFLLNLNSSVLMVGASGAVSAVVALFIFYYPRSTLLAFGIIPIRTWILGVIIVGVDLLRSFNPESPIAWEAHLAGFAFGAAYHYFKLNFQRLDFSGLKKVFGSQPNLKIHKPEKLKLEADAILQKINEHGEESLTSKERKTLERYSAQVRNDRDA